MYGRLEGNKIVVKDKVFKNNEDYGCNTSRHFIFSPDHNKFITGVEIHKWEDDSPDSEMNTIDSEYLFELKQIQYIILQNAKKKNYLYISLLNFIVHFYIHLVNYDK